MRTISPLIIAAAFACASVFGADPVSSDYLVSDGSWGGDVGIENGIVARTTVYTNLAPYTGSAATINSALSNCPSNQVVVLQAGTFLLSSTINGVSYTTLRGETNASGVPTTVVQFSAGTPNPAILAGTTGWDLSNTNSFTNREVTSPAPGSLRGVSTVTLNSAPTGLVVGQTGFLNATNQGDDFYGFGSSGARRTFTHWFRVTAISGSDVTISPVINADFLAGAVWLSYKAGGSMLRRFGVEDLTLERNGAGAISFVKFNGSDECWLKNLKAGPTTGGSQVHHVDVYGSFRCEIRHCELFGQDAYGNSSYAINNYFSGSFLIVDNYIHDIANVMPMFNVHNMAFAYNYINGLSYDAPNNWLSQIVFFHRAFNSYNLVEGNWLATMFNDNNSGAGGGDNCASKNNVVLRNRMRGYDTDGETGTTTGNTEAMTLSSRHQRFVMAGNVLGENGIHNTLLNTFVTDEATPGDTIYNVSTSATNTFFRRHNYNTVTDGVPAEEALTGGQEISSSYLLASQPSTIVHYWPAIDSSLMTSFSGKADATNLLAAAYRASVGQDPPWTAESGGASSAPVARKMRWARFRGR